MGLAADSHFLANDRLLVFITRAGTGWTAFEDCLLTARRVDRRLEGAGAFVYVRDASTGHVWSLGHEPVRHGASSYEVHAEPGSVRIERSDEEIEATLDIAVDPELATEIRRVTLVNRSPRAREIELTTYAEIVLAPAAAHASHPAFSKLFVQTEWVPEVGALLAHRRPRGAGEEWPWLVHALLEASAAQVETDRSRFVGRGRTLAAPLALSSEIGLSGSVGNVLDPIASVRCRVSLAPGARAERTFMLGAGADRDEVLTLAARYRRPGAVRDVFDRARRAAHAMLAEQDLDAAEAASFEALAGAMLVGEGTLRDGGALALEASEAGDLDRLAALGVPPFVPHAVLHAETAAGQALLERALKMHALWRRRRLPVALWVVYEDELPEALADLEPEARPNLLRAGDAGERLVQLLDASSSAILRDLWPELPPVRSFGPPAVLERPVAPAAGASRASNPGAGTVGFNGIGGFDPEPNEYVLHVSPDATGALQLPPRPWVNVVANERCGFLVSETGAGCTWSGNSREHRLTPWSNDAVVDPHGEALFVRDEATGRAWSLWPGPAPAPVPYEIRHGIGYTRCRHEVESLEIESVAFVAWQDPIKYTRISIRNIGTVKRRLSVFAYSELVLGGLPETSGRSVVTSIDPESGTVWARNALSGDWAGSVVFSHPVLPAGHSEVQATAERSEFLGAEGTLAQPAAVCSGTPFTSQAGAGLDPCAAHRVVLEIEAGETAEVTFLLGAGDDAVEAQRLVRAHASSAAVEGAWHDMRAAWQALVGAVQVTTPMPALDLVANGWLLYQVLSCRMWGRSAFYQSGGAFGFRDQLQDASSLLLASPERFRSQILLHAAHQFREGDVLHWWHPPLDRGLRTRFADDLLWLPHLAAFYIDATGDTAMLDERLPFLAARELEPGEDEAFLLPQRSGESADLYTHCCRAIDRSLERGAHGLPLFGSGDWNDGMNRVGREGRGESVWMGFFLYTVLGEFAALAAQRGDEDRARRYEAFRTELQQAIESAAWDGSWYRRGYYDDGTPLGSSTSDECRIDALVQAWAVLSGAAPRQRAAAAMDAVEEQLVSASEGLVRLLRPPFDRTPHDPGYIKGYVPGVRENGGQYTHAALWVVRALAELGRNDRAAALLEMLSPVTRAATPDRVAIYQVEPYVVAADVYGAPPHVGRGGWTWYTGSAGWMQRVLLESILGLRLRDGNVLEIAPCVPDTWPEFSIVYRRPRDGTCWEIRAANPHRQGRGVREAHLDGTSVPITGGRARIPLAADGGLHRVELVLGAPLEAVR